MYMPKDKNFFRRGMSLIELIVTISIIVFLGAASLVSLLSSRNVRDLTTSGQNVLSVLKLAQSKSLAGEGNTTWGVHFESNRVVLFQGPSYVSLGTTTPYALPQSLQIANINLFGGGSDVIFKKITGTTDQSGSVDIQIISTPTSVFSIAIDASGKVYPVSIAVTPTDTRITDARHRLFTLDWSIQSSTNLVLTFSDPPSADTVQTIVMSPYFDPLKTKFDWSGTVSVGGQNQVLRIHTTQLTSTTTALSVDRDCRFNTKKLQISIDANDIATYEADCTTITVGAFGGTMSEL